MNARGKAPYEFKRLLLRQGPQRDMGGATRSDSWPDILHLGCEQNKGRVSRRIFERFEENVARLRRERMDVLDYYDLLPREGIASTNRQEIPQTFLTSLIRGVERDMPNVHSSFSSFATGPAFAARRSFFEWAFTEEGVGHEVRQRSLTGSLGSK